MRLNTEEYYKEIQELQNVIFNPALKEKMKPLFWDYFEPMVTTNVTTKEGIKLYFLQNAVISELLETKGKKILDVGCGFGLRLICLALLGSRKAIGIDISGEMIEGFQILSREFPHLRIENKEEDFLYTDYPPSSFDVVILEESISHIRDTQLLLDKIQHVLCPRGILYISDANNDLFLPNRIRSRRIWRRSEYGPIDENMAKHGRKVDKLPFFEARIKIIEECYPSLDTEMVKVIARKTQGLWGEEIAKAVNEFLATGEIYQKASFPWRNPYTGEFPELGFNPFRLIKDLRGRGFRCRLVPPPWAYTGLIKTTNFPRWKFYIANLLPSVLRKSPQTLLPFLSPSFHITAIKESM